ncbi:DJ-1/PfpI/YhbO family deglycase/protease [candidate division KSB1 bacterium]|nr:MAG: DJ-1/PfpI/YhbO family deglycase/protease [candidate division KSB1 bacterium]
MLKDKKIMILVAANFHDEETTKPRDFFQKQDALVDVVGLESGEITGKYGRVMLSPDKVITQVRPDDYDALIIPGGGAPERIRVNLAAVDFVRNFWNSGRPIAAICHGPQVLISAKVLEGITLTAYVGIRDDIINAGGHYVDQPVCVDGQLITSRKPEDLPAFNETLNTALSTGFLPDDEMAFDPLKALQFAVCREKGAQQFYTAVAEIAAKESIRNKFLYLADVETGHFDQLVDLYKQISGGSDPVVDLNLSEIRRDIVTPEITVEEAIDLAIQAEQKAYDYYRNAALKSKSQSAQQMFEYLAVEELEHKRLLSVDKAAMQGGQGHFQWATHFDIPPGMDDLW